MDSLCQLQLVILRVARLSWLYPLRPHSKTIICTVVNLTAHLPGSHDFPQKGCFSVDFGNLEIVPILGSVPVRLLEVWQIPLPSHPEPLSNEGNCLNKPSSSSLTLVEKSTSAVPTADLEFIFDLHLAFWFLAVNKSTIKLPLPKIHHPYSILQIPLAQLQGLVFRVSLGLQMIIVFPVGRYFTRREEGSWRAWVVLPGMDFMKSRFTPISIKKRLSF